MDLEQELFDFLQNFALNSHPQAIVEILQLLNSRPDLRKAAELWFATGHGETQLSLTSLLHELLPLEEREIFPRLPGYEVLCRLGSGGMGEVFLAQSMPPLDSRTAAIKMINPCLLGPDTLQSFYSEMKILASLNHPGIPTIYDQGKSEDGAPFFAMEWISGTTLIEYCQSRSLSLHERLSLFCEACEAVDAAHHKSILHLDLKPSNILVRLEGHAHAIKVIDFGIARFLGHDATRNGQPLTPATVPLGTIAFISPEQLEPGLYGLDRRADIYGLGGVLYQMITGQLPRDLRDDSIDMEQWKKILRDDELIPPSKCNATLLLNEKIPADLDAIVLRMMAWDPELRYRDLSMVLEDLRRYQQGEVLLAQEKDLGARTRKWIGRNRGRFGFAAALCLALLLSLWSWSRWEKRAQRLQTEKTQVEERSAKMEAEIRAASAFIGKLTRESQLDSGASLKQMRRNLLDMAARVETEFKDFPNLRIQNRIELIKALSDLGDQDSAHEQLQRAFADQRLEGKEDKIFLKLKSIESDYLRLKEEYVPAVKSYEAVLALGTRLHASRGFMDTQLFNLARCHVGLGNFSEAEALVKSALRTIDPQKEPERLGTAYARWGAMLLLCGRPTEAELIVQAQYEESLRLADSQVETSIRALRQLANTHMDLGKWKQAELEFKQVAMLRKQTLGDQDPNALGAHYDLMTVQYLRNKKQEFRAAYQALESEEGPSQATQALADKRRKIGYLHFIMEGKPVELLRESLHGLELVREEDAKGMRYLLALADYGDALNRNGRFADGAQAMEEVLARSRTFPFVNPQYLLTWRITLAESHLALGQFQAGVDALEGAELERPWGLDPSMPLVNLGLAKLGLCFLGLRDGAEAHRLLQLAYHACPEEDWRTAGVVEAAAPKLAGLGFRLSLDRPRPAGLASSAGP